MSAELRPEYCTTPSHRLRHRSLSLESGRVPGRSGRTLCGVDAVDEKRANYWLAMWRGSKPLVIEGLRDCRACLRSAALHAQLQGGGRRG